MRNTTNGRRVVTMLLTLSFVLCLTGPGTAQVSTDRTANIERPATTTSASSREALLIDRIEKLERRLAELEAKLNAKAPSSIDTVASAPAEPETRPLAQTDKADGSALEFLSDTTFNVTFDGYYGYKNRIPRRSVWSGGSGESKEHGDASNRKQFETNDNGNDVAGFEVIQLAVHRAVHRLAHIAAPSKGTRVTTEAVEPGPFNES